MCVPQIMANAILADHNNRNFRRKRALNTYSADRINYLIADLYTSNPVYVANGG